ncbi:hypothetical protein HNR42_002881 [Deinobacterium chartae]|uniref:Uncharacterized protein n=1 Tax=Deinobacterium chartae TaxID=521158 RepID=A0A841I4T8_9DEIO|nr:hypothetical protein [Deinobacterium chartae]MBB6099440.1 hypothetical protein [Deinobacterium chartae]
MQTQELVPEVRESIEQRLPEVCARLLPEGSDACGLEAFEVITQQRPNGTVLVSMRLKPEEHLGQTRISAATATFELTPTLEGGRWVYHGTPVEFLTSSL